MSEVSSVEWKTLAEFHKLFDSPEESIENIQPKFEQKCGICISTSNFYVKYASCLLLSIIENASSNNFYDILVLTTDMSVENQYIIKALTQSDNISIRIFNIDEEIRKYSFYTWSHFTPNTYYRLAIPQLFKNFERVLYLDSDTIVNTDINKIFDIDFEDCFVAACKDTHVLAYCNGVHLEQLEYNTNVLKLPNPTEYFQMGVSLYNISKFNKDFTDKSLLEIAGKAKFRWLDQDVLNVQFHGQIKELPIKWNVMIMNKPPHIDEYHLPEPYLQQYREARMNPGIIHYCGGVYYRHPFLPDMGRFFWKYALMSPFFEEIIVRMLVLKLPKHQAQNNELDCLRDEFQKTHFPNINSRFESNEYNARLLYILSNSVQFIIRKYLCKFRAALAFGKKKEKYRRKYEELRKLIKDAKLFKKRLKHV